MQEKFKVDLRGVVDLLSRHLYSSQGIFVRELAQNAVDALTARRAIGTPPGWAPRIDVGPVARSDGRRQVMVSDNGIGLTDNEMRDVLATIGASSKRDVVELTGRGYLGQFGVGLLSCFLVTDEVAVRSRSAAAAGDDTFLWSGRDDGTYTITRAAPRDEPGTDVTFVVRAHDEAVLRPHLLEKSLREYVTYLPEPIHLTDATGHDELVSGRTPLWQLTGHELVRAAEDLLGWVPLASFPVSAPAAGVEGIALVVPHHVFGHRRAGDRIYLRGMLLSDDDTSLLPDSAFFVRVVAEAGSLRPTASREALHDTELLREVRTVLGRQVTGWLAECAHERPELLDQILTTHSEGLLACAADDESVLRVLLDCFPLETTDGDLTMAQISERQEPLRYVGSIERFRALTEMARGQGVLLVNVGHVREEPYLLAAAWLLSLEVTEMGSEELRAGFVEPSPDQRARFAPLVRLAEDLPLDLDAVRPASIRPASVPAVFLGRSLPRSYGEVSDEFLRELLGHDDDTQDELLLNVESPLVRRLLDQVSARPDVVAAAVTSVAAVARLHAGARLPGGGTETLAAAIDSLVRSATQPPHPTTGGSP